MGEIKQFDNIPKQLQEKGLFCCWKYEERNGCKTKVPYSPGRFCHAKTNDPDTFTYFEDAVRLIEQDFYDGIGIGVFGNVGAIDIDGCISEDGKFTEQAIDIIKVMHSYTEISPSKRGVHILFKTTDFVYDKDKYFIMNSGRGLEVYVAGITNKYVTVTGRKIGAYEFGDRTEELKIVLDKYMKRTSSAVNGENAVKGIYATNDGLPERAFNARNGAKFRRLYEGDRSDYDSQSEADLALCRHLAFWTGNNPERMDELFRSSGLFREKWDRIQSGTTYGRITIQKAIDSCQNTVSDNRGREESQEDFLPLRDLNNDSSNLPAFPIEALPPVISCYVQAVSKHTQTAPDMAGTISLGVLAVCLQGKYRIEGSPGYYEPLSLYTVVIAEPGERKSSVMNAMTKPLYDYEEEYNATHAKDMRANRLERAKLEQQIQFCEEKLKKKDDDSIFDRLIMLQNSLDEKPELRPLRLLADDASVEALTSLLACNNGRIGVISAEGGVFDNLRGRYSQVQSIDVWLKGHCGDPIMVDRLGRSAERISHPHLSAVLAIQPYVLGEIMGNEKFSGRGLLARFLYSSPQSLIGKRQFVSPEIPEQAREDYKLLLYRLLGFQPAEIQTLQLSHGAQSIMNAHFSEHEQFLVGEGQAISEWANKYIGAVLRIAGILHVAKETDSLQVSDATIMQAISIGQYFLEHSKYAYSLAGNDTTIKGARFILNRIKEKQIHRIKKWELGKECRSKLFKNAEDLMPALMLLEQRGYIRLINPEEKSGPGRKPDVQIVVNPLVHWDAVNTM